MSTSEVFDPTYEVAAPNPDALIESLRALGYTTPAALADLIDNSITAGARTVRLTFHWDGPDSYVRIDDDGRGMSEPELGEAMRLGSRDPLATLDQRELGRFGLGLKSASFAQCRTLTVRSHRQGHPVATRVWDLDFVRSHREWRLIRQAGAVSERLLAYVGGIEHGTSILWERLDRIVDSSPADNRAAHDRFLQLQELVERHLAMVFHRFMERPTALRISINDRVIDPWDPFIRDHPSTQALAHEPLYLQGSRVEVAPYVLPHHSKLTGDAHQRGAGPNGWNAHQGFYVYRNRRLLLAGGWLGLGMQREEHYKLARIRVDLPNTMDHEWQIDVRKASATPPGALRADLKRIAQATRRKAAEVYRFRGKRAARAAAADFVFVWEPIRKRGKVHYRINRQHPLVASALKGQLVEPRAIRGLLSLIEETIPKPVIAMDHSEHEVDQAAPFETADRDDVVTVLHSVFDALLKQGLDRRRARERITAMEPFASIPDLQAELDAIEEAE